MKKKTTFRLVALAILMTLCGSAIFAQAPSNDGCANAIPLSYSGTQLTVSGTTKDATPSLSIPAPSFGQPDDDVWYSFVAAATDLKIDIPNGTATVPGSSSLYMMAQVLSGTCGNLTSIYSVDEHDIFGNLIVGQTYYIRVFTISSSLEALSFDLTLSPVTSLPGCSSLSSPVTNSIQSPQPSLYYNAINASGYDIYLDHNNPPTTLLASINGRRNYIYTLPAPLAPGDYYWSVVARNSLGIAPGCTQINKFTVPPPPPNDLCANAILLIEDTSCAPVSGSSLGSTYEPGFSAQGDVWYSFVATATDARISLLDAITGYEMDFEIYDSCGSLVPHYSNTNGGAPVIGGLTIGQSYFIRILYSDYHNQFTICVTRPTIAPDGCSWPGYTSPVDGQDASNTPQLNFTFGDIGASSYDIYLDVDTPIAFLTNYVPDYNYPQYSYQVTTPLAPGKHYWRVEARNSAGHFACRYDSFNVVATPVNDEPQSAISLTQDINCNVRVAGSTVSATPSLYPAMCGGNADDDVWYTFVATSANAEIILTDVDVRSSASSGDSRDLNIVTEVFSGNPGSLTSLACNANSSWITLLDNITVGQTYYIRVYTYGGNDVSTKASFKICVKGDPVLGINDHTSKQALGLKVYPNPARDYLGITMKNQPSKVSVTITDASGRNLIKEIYGPNMLHNRQNISVSSLPAGIYFLDIRGDGIRIADKFVKQ